MKKRLLLKGGRIITMNAKREVIDGDLLFENSRILKIAAEIPATADTEVIPVKNHFVIPGLIQAHTHLCQALFRGLADDMVLLDWLRKRIWPLESNHSPESLAASARIGLMEMQLLGTTAILDMATVLHTDSVFQAAVESGIRYWGGKCLMDDRKTSGPLYEKTEDGLKETEELIQRWHNKNDLINYAICPRFGVSSTDRLLKGCAKLQEKFGILIHTHASESKDEVALIKRRTGQRNVDYLHTMGLLNEQTVLVHGVHLSAGELKKMIKNKTALVHCPSSNMKLASGIAPIESYIEDGLTVALGSDGAPCNNTMDPFVEMRLAALLQKPAFGPDALPAQAALEMATLGGAKALKQESSIGSLEVGKQADIVTVDRSHPSVATVENPYSALVYSCSGRDVRDVFIAGRPTVRGGRHQVYDHGDVVENARAELKKVAQRAFGRDALPAI